jgi:hypothetical protein
LSIAICVVGQKHNPQEQHGHARNFGEFVDLGLPFVDFVLEVFLSENIRTNRRTQITLTPSNNLHSRVFENLLRQSQSFRFDNKKGFNSFREITKFWTVSV